MTLYDKIGVNYSQTRKSDPRIASKLLKILNLSKDSVIADVGAGTGSYSLILANICRKKYFFRVSLRFSKDKLHQA